MTKRGIFYLVIMILLTGSQPILAQVVRNLTFENVNRNYILYVPEDLPAGESVPLIFILHGFTQSAQVIMEYSGFNQLAEEHRFIAVYPNGVGNAWNTNSGFPGGSTANDVGFIGSIMDELIREFPVDPDRMYSCGFSAGGFMSHLLACELSDRVAAIASVAGTMSANAFDQCMPEFPIPILQIHGTNDLIVSYGGSFANIPVDDMIEFWTQGNDCPVEPSFRMLPDLVNEGSTVEEYRYSPCKNEGEVMLLKVINGGHTWPGSSASGLGNTNRDIDASAEIWNFFSRFKRGMTPSTTIDPGTETIHFYPNPVAYQLFFEMEKGITELDIYSPDGRRLFHVINPEGSFILSVENLSPGTYVVRARKQGNVLLRKFSKI